MTILVWDNLEDRRYETGLDRGVLYLQDGTAVPWNGLVEVSEKNTGDSKPVYFDGRKINNLVSLGDFEASLKAVTYPDELVPLEGMGRLRNGAWLGEQKVDLFNLSYRSRIGNAVDGDSGYKIHIIYNAIANPSDVTRSSVSDSPNLIEFEWDIQTIPEDLDGFRPTAHFVIDSRDFDPWLLEDIEEKLYGGPFAEPDLPPLPELVDYIKNWYRWKVTDLGDGTYKLESGRGDALVFSGTNLEIFQALGVYVIDHGDGTFTVYDTYDIADVPEIKIIDNGDGTWTATTSFDNLFAVDEFGYFNILNANATMIAPDEYRLSDTRE
jgi:hypothetical protein